MALRSYHTCRFLHSSFLPRLPLRHGQQHIVSKKVDEDIMQKNTMQLELEHTQTANLTVSSSLRRGSVRTKHLHHLQPIKTTVLKDNHTKPAPVVSSSWAAARRSYSTDKLDSEAISNEEINITDRYKEEVHGDLSTISLKELLYKETDDVMTQLNACQTHDELQTAIALNESRLQLAHRVQCVILLWTYFNNADENSAHDLLFHPMLERVMKALLPHLSAMSSSEWSCCYLYLRKMGVQNSHALLQTLFEQGLQYVETATEHIPLTTLSRFIVGINAGRDVDLTTTCSGFLKHIKQHIAKCSTDEDARLLAICLLNLQPLIDKETLEDFKCRIRDFLATGVINADTHKTIVKLLHLFNRPVWSHLNAALIRDLMLALLDSVPELSERELTTVCRIFQHHLEPAALAAPLKSAIEKLLDTQPSADTLACFMPFAEPQRRESLIALFKQLYTNPESWRPPNGSGNLFAILRALKISDVKVCDRYWLAVLDELDTDTLQLRFLRHCHRYMNFNNNLGGTYRHLPLEKKLSGMCMAAIEMNAFADDPVTFTRLASFVLAYGHTDYGWKKFPNIVLSKIIGMADRFSIMDCYLITRGLQIALEMRFRYPTSVLKIQLDTIDSVLIACAERHLDTKETLTVGDVNLIVRSLGNRKSLKKCVVYSRAFDKYRELDYSDLSSRAIRDMVHNFYSSNFYIPEALDAMFAYIEKNHEHVIGDIVEKVLSCAYNVGYSPKSLDVLDHTAKILMRDFNNMSAISLVQACLSLCFYKVIPQELVDRVFCLSFIRRMEEEIQLCYSKVSYPDRVLNLVMQLNRTVCLDFPEANVPWFQQAYIEAQMSKKPSVNNRFTEDVKQLLRSLLKDDTYFCCNHTTPYGYQIDFVIHFDRDKQKLIPAPVETTMLDRITKVAILLLKLDSFCENDLRTLRGPESLKIKHLEMLGYKVLHINEYDWNSKYMNAPGAKANYLKCLLKIAN